MSARITKACFLVFSFFLFSDVAMGQTAAKEGIFSADSTDAQQPVFYMNRESPDEATQLYGRAVLGSNAMISPANRHAFISESQKNRGIQRWKSRLVNPVYGGRGSQFRWTLFAPDLFYSSNSDFPIGQNDGALWQGVGGNVAVRSGAGVAYGPLTVVFRPVYVSSENRDFTTSSFPVFSGISEFGRPLSNIDFPQRFGDERTEEFNLGDSFAQVAVKGVAAGVSNERFSMGPAIYNPLLLGYNAPGFVHGFLKSDSPVQTVAGDLSGSWFWGTLEESDYFDSDATNNRRTITGFTLEYRPSFLNGLDVGVNRVAYGTYPDGGLGVSDILTAFRLSPPKSSNSVSDAYHVMTSVYARWVFEAAGAELYGEWGLNNNRRRVRDLLAEPELNRGFMIGFLKTFLFSGERRLVLNIEATNLENSSVGSQFRNETNTWYEHETIRQGFTHKGQLLGAGIGPGSSGETGRLAYFGRWGMAGVNLKRVAWFYDRFFREQDTYVRLYPFGEEKFFMLDRFTNMWSYGAEAVLFLPFGVDLRAEYQHTSIHNLYNRFRNDLENNRFQVSLRKNF